MARLLSAVVTPRLRRLALLLALASLLFTAAKCIENETLYQDASGDWHVVSEIHNETDVWGAGMILGGQLLNANGDVIATTQTGVCPQELAPHTFDAFDLHFSNSSGLEPATYKVNVIEGHALDLPLQPSGLSLVGFKATKVSSGVNISGTVQSTRTYTRVLVGCVAFYNSAGRVVTHITVINFGLTLPLEDGEPQPVGFTIPDVEPGATSVRIWLAGDSDTPFASDYAAVMTGSIAIR